MIFGLLDMWTQYAYLEQLSVGITSLPGSQERGSLTKDAVGILFYQQAGQLLSDAIILSSLECVQAASFWALTHCQLMHQVCHTSTPA